MYYFKNSNNNNNRYHSINETVYCHGLRNLMIKSTPNFSKYCNIGYALNHVIASIGQNIVLSLGTNHCIIYHNRHARNILATSFHQLNVSHLDDLYM